MKVVSCFDGMSCLQIALEKLGIVFDGEKNKYYASEIDKYAMQITQKNYPNTIQLGDIRYIKPNPKKKMDIDLLAGGSPCQGFSFAGKQLNFEDPRSKLFFEFVRLLKEIKPKYFLLENVRMKKEYQDVISSYLGVEPIMINSSLVSAQNRVRLYWTNINTGPGPKDKGIFLKDILENNNGIGARMVGRARNADGKRIDHKQSVAGITKQEIEINNNPNKTNCLSSVQKDNIIVHNIYGGFKENNCRVFENKSPTIRTAAGGGHIPSVFNGSKEDAKRISLKKLRDNIRKLTPLECERLQTVPDNYTEGVSNTQRYKMLGNGWTVDVIAHILKKADYDKY